MAGYVSLIGEIVDGLTPKQTQVIAALMAGKTIVECSEMSNVSERSIYRWLNDAEFRDAMHQAQRDALDETGRRLAGLTSRAVEVLAQLLEYAGPGDNVRRLAAGDILSTAFRWVVSTDVEKRLDALEGRE